MLGHWYTLLLAAPPAAPVYTLTPDDIAAIAAAVLSAAAAAPIAADVQRVRGQALEGTGTSGDPWGPA